MEFRNCKYVIPLYHSLEPKRKFPFLLVKPPVGTKTELRNCKFLIPLYHHMEPRRNLEAF